LTASVSRLVAARPGQAGSVAARPGRPRAPRLVDVALAAAAFAGSLALYSHGERVGLFHPRTGGLNPSHVVLVTLATVPLLAWRRFPLGVFAVTAAASVLLAVIGEVIWPPLGPATALYLLASGRHDTRSWTPRDTGTVVLLLLAYLGAGVAAVGIAGGDLFHAGLACAAAWFAGERTRLRREQVADLRRRATHAEQAAARERQLAVAEERTRIARDLHDSAGHALNVIAVRAGAARLRHAQEPDRSLNALTAIEDIARQTVSDIDQFVAALRVDDTGAGTVETPPGLASLDTLIAHHTAAGLRVTVSRTGTAGTIAPASDQAAYRIVQEALTNAARHGTGTAHLALAFERTALDITVTNPVGAGVAAPATRGHGLVGMRERTALLGGDLTLERGGDTFRVSARIPSTRGRP
jgi:signal transduction histidine kinase